MAELLKAQQAHISDLRVLVDQAQAREAKLAGMVQMVMEERFYRPTVTRDPKNERKTAPGIDPEALNDVAQFDAEADREQMEQGEQLEREIEEEFKAILSEENEFRSSRGMDAVPA
jgi:hypothetical protein